MLALAFLSWWYSKGWTELISKLIAFIDSIGQLFSVKILLKTLFDPWRRITSTGSIGISSYLHAAVDNTISRLVGLTVRLLVLTAGLLFSLVIIVVGCLVIIIWPLLPPAFILTIVLGLFK